MKIGAHVHQLRIGFSVTEAVKRFVNLYLIAGKHCWLIDAGVAGCGETVTAYLQSIGRDLSELRGIFLTHAHPDHMGGAAELKAQTGCQVYASQGESRWVQDRDLQFRERPIPNFYGLVGGSVPVDRVLADGDVIELETGLSLAAVSTPGHGADDLSYFLREEGVLFTGDAVPVEGDIPIYVDWERSLASLARLKSLPGVKAWCAAWDQVHWGQEGLAAIQRGEQVIARLGTAVEQVRTPGMPLEETAAKVCGVLKSPGLMGNPLFLRTIASHCTTR